jgi:hypothetical protein
MSLLEQMLEKTPAEQKATLTGFCAGWDACLKRYGTIPLCPRLYGFNTRSRRGVGEIPTGD